MGSSSTYNFWIATGTTGIFTTGGITFRFNGVDGNATTVVCGSVEADWYCYFKGLKPAPV